MPTLWARTVNFESINPGDQLPIVIKWETVESIQRFNARAAANIPEDSPEDSGEDLDTEPALPSSALVAYVKELLAKAFPPESITAPTSRLDLELTAPVRAEDTISLSGKVVFKGEDGLVECEIVIENHRQETIGRAAAVVTLTLGSQATSSQEAV
ncbi:MAG TPA: hypothetical protein VFR55_14380 [Dehalococcoidia bacterium]|nr:hypothetical protein [Dehalococcoidia bacterium]